MSLKKNLGLSIATAALGISLVSGGTVAYFNDIEETENAFSAGKLDIQLMDKDGNSEVDLKITNMKPGEQIDHVIQIFNEGTLDVKDVKMNVEFTDITDANGDNGSEKFADHILVNIERQDSNKVITDWIPLTKIGNIIVAENLKPRSGNNNSIRLKFTFKFNDNGGDQNTFQGDSIDFKLIFEASQKSEE